MASSTSEAADDRRLRSSRATGLGRQRELAILAAILAFALALRVGYVLAMRANPFFDDPQLDQRVFCDWGRAIAAGREFHDGPMLRAPLYAWFLAACFKLFGPSLLAVRLLQACMGTAMVAFVHLVAKRLFDARVGLVAAFIAAAYWILVYYDGEILRESPANMLNMLALWLTLACADRRSLAFGACAGLAWGASALLRPQVLVVVPFLALWLARVAHARPSAIAAFALAVLAPILPVTAYNVFIGHDLVLISPEGGQALWIANNPAADGVTGVAPGTRADWWGNIEDGRAIAERDEGRALKPSEISSYYARRTWRFFVEDPARAARLLLEKLHVFLTDWEFGSNPEEPRFFVERFAPFLLWIPLSFGIVASLAALGFVTSARGAWMARFPLWAFLALYGATVVLFLVSARHRLPVLPALAIYAACGVVWLADAWRTRDRTKLAIGLAGCGIAYLATNSLEVPKAFSTSNGWVWLAYAERRDGRDESAIALLRRAIAIAPDNARAYTALGVVLHALDRDDEAIEALQRAVAITPADIEALDALSDACLKRGRFVEARAAAEKRVAIAPHLSRAYYALGRAQLKLGDVDAASAAFRNAIARKPDYFNAAYALGILARLAHRDDEALDALARAVEHSADARPEFVVDAYANLIDVLTAHGRKAEAVDRAEQMVRRFPDDARAKALRDGLR
jgi:tetratricopeptide (TPR) repeat protein